MKVGSELGHSGRGLHSLAGSTHLLEMGPRPLEGTWHGVVSAALLLVARCVVHRRCGVNVTSSGTCDCANLRRRDDVEDRPADAVRPVTCRRQSLY